MDEVASERAFKQVKSWQEFLKLWSRVYSNEIYIPGYGAKFIDDAGDNPQVNLELGSIFQDITMMGVVCNNSQVSIKGEQKAYFTGFSFQHIAYPLFIELNRHEGISAIMLDLSNMRPTESFSYFPFVTYSDWNKDKTESRNRMKGTASTHLGIDFSTGDLDIAEWLNDDMKKVISTDNMCQILVWDANTSSPAFHLFEVVRQALKYVHMQNNLFAAFDKGDKENVIKLIQEMKSQNISPDVQQHGYGLHSTSMLSTVIVNVLNSKGKKFKVVLDLLLQEIETVDVNLYTTLLASCKKNFPKKKVEKLFQLLHSKLPSWFKAD